MKKRIRHVAASLFVIATALSLFYSKARAEEFKFVNKDYISEGLLTKEKKGFYSTLGNKNRPFFDPGIGSGDGKDWRGWFTQIKTAGGILTSLYVEGDFYSLLLDDITLAKAITIHFRDVFQEKKGLPQIILAHISSGGYRISNVNEAAYIVDTAVKPAFISKEYLPLLLEYRANHAKGDYRVTERLQMKKLAEGVYSFTGRSFEKTCPDGHPCLETYIYDRNRKSLEKAPAGGKAQKLEK